MGEVKVGVAQEALGRFAALGYRDFRLVFYTSIVSNVGNWMEIVLRNWLVYEISRGSPLILGLANTAHWLPFLVVAPLAGVYVDRWNKKWVLVVTQGILTVVTMLLGLLTLMGMIKIWHILVLVLIHGLAESFDNPARQSLVSDLVGREAVMNAVSLNSAAYYGTRLVGPAIGGFLIATSGTGLGFVINALTFVPYILALPLVHAGRAAGGRKNTWRDLRSGLAYVRRTPVVLTILLTVGLTSVFSVSYQTLMPIFAAEVLRVGPQGLGFLNSATGLGGLLGAFALAYYSGRLQRQGLFICLTAGLFGLSLLAFSLSGWYWFSLSCLVAAGASNVAFSSSSNAVLQTRAPDDLRGRVMGVFTMTSLGTNVFGSLVMAGLAEAFGAPLGLGLAAGIALVVPVVAYVIAPELRR